MIEANGDVLCDDGLLNLPEFLAAIRLLHRRNFRFRAL